MKLKDRVVVLTGASRGIGAAIALDLARDGAHLVLAARSAEALETVASAVREAGGQATVVPTDVTVPAQREALLAAARAIGPIAVLVNNAGIEIAVAVVDQRAAEVQRQIDVNLVAPLELTRLVLAEMIEAGEGAVITISSMSGKSPTPYNPIYTATKFGLNGFTASLRLELAGTGVTAGVVCPSFVAEAGIWHDSGVKAPMAMREVPLSKVTAGVRKVLAGKGEVLVTPAPVRPLLALGQLLPWIDGPALRFMGILPALKERARVTLAGRGTDS